MAIHHVLATALCAVIFGAAEGYPYLPQSYKVNAAVIQHQARQNAFHRRMQGYEDPNAFLPYDNSAPFNPDLGTSGDSQDYYDDDSSQVFYDPTMDNMAQTYSDDSNGSFGEDQDDSVDQLRQGSWDNPSKYNGRLRNIIDSTDLGKVADPNSLLGLAEIQHMGNFGEFQRGDKNRDQITEKPKTNQHFNRFRQGSKYDHFPRQPWYFGPKPQQQLGVPNNVQSGLREGFNLRSKSFPGLPFPAKEFNQRLFIEHHHTIAFEDSSVKKNRTLIGCFPEGYVLNPDQHMFQEELVMSDSHPPLNRLKCIYVTPKSLKNDISEMFWKPSSHQFDDFTEIADKPHTKGDGVYLEDLAVQKLKEKGRNGKAKKSKVKSGKKLNKDRKKNIGGKSGRQKGAEKIKGDEKEIKPGKYREKKVKPRKEVKVKENKKLKKINKEAQTSQEKETKSDKYREKKVKPRKEVKVKENKKLKKINEEADTSQEQVVKDKEKKDNESDTKKEKSLQKLSKKYRKENLKQISGKSDKKLDQKKDQKSKGEKTPEKLKSKKLPKNKLRSKKFKAHKKDKNRRSSKKKLARKLVLSEDDVDKLIATERLKEKMAKKI